MLVKYRIPVEHRGSASSGAQFEWDGAVYKFKVIEGKLEELEVLVRNFPASALPRIIPASGAGALPTISIPSDPVWTAIERRLMFMEGAAAMFGLRHLNFENRTTEWIPETEEERVSVDLFSFKMEKNANGEATPIAFDMFARSLIVADELSSLEVALNFSRRGRADLAEGRCIEAVYDFYFVLETLFANGAFKQKEVLRHFESQKELLDAVSASRRMLSQDREFVRQASLSASTTYTHGSEREILARLIQVRGFLHHHSSKNPKAWHPNEQETYRADAVFLAQVCFEILGSRIFSCMYSERSVAEFSDIVFLTESGEKIRFVAMT